MAIKAIRTTGGVGASGAGGGGGGGGGELPGAAPNVTIDPVAEVIFRNNKVVEVDVEWTQDPTATPQSFSGVAVYLEDPDISGGTQSPLDTATGTALNGTAQVSGQWVPKYETDSFVQAGTSSGVAVVFPDSDTTYTQSRNVRIYLASFGPNTTALPVRANLPGATPNIMVEVPQGPGQGQSGMEWAFLVQWDDVPGPQTTPSVTVATDYNRPDPKYTLEFYYEQPDPSSPVPPGVNRFGGVRIVFVQYDTSGNPIFPGTDSGINVPVDQSSTGYKSSVYDASAGGSKFRVYFCSEDDASPLGLHVNSLVDGTTPWAEAVVPPISPTIIDVTGLTISNEKVSWQLDNTLVAQATFAWSLPSASTASGNFYAGVRLYLVNVVADTGNNGSVPLTSFPQPLSDIQANVDTGLTVYETPPGQPEIWTVAAISVNSSGGLQDIPGDFGKPDFHSPTVLWHINNVLSSGDAASVTVNTGATAVATQTQTSDGVGMVSFNVGPWTNPADASFGGVQVAMVTNSNPASAIFWQVPNGATTFTTPPIPTFGNLGATVPVEFYLVSDDPQGHKNPLQPGATPKIVSSYVPAEGAIIPSRSGWYSSEFSWGSGGFQADSFAAQKILVGSQLIVGGAPSSFSGNTVGSQNGQVAVLNASGNLVAWMGESTPSAGGGQGQGAAGIYGGWFGQIYIGGTSPLDAPVYVDGNGIIEVGGIGPAQNSSAYPYISIRDAHGLEMGRIGAQLTAPSPTGSSGNQGGVGSSPTAGNLAQLTAGAWFTQLAIGGSNLSNWNVLITPTTVGNPLGSDFLMRNLYLFSIDYAAQFGSPANQEYRLEFGQNIWTGTAGTATNGQWQFPGVHLYEVDNNLNLFGTTILNRGIVLRGHGNQGCPVLCSLVTYNGLSTGSDGPPYNFWADLEMYSPTSPYYPTVSLSSGGQNTGNASFALRDYNALTLFLVDTSGNTQINGVLSGVPNRSTGAATPVTGFAFNVGTITNPIPVIDSTGKWVGLPITVASNQTPWASDIYGAGNRLLGAGEIHGSAFFLGGATPGAGIEVIDSTAAFRGTGGVNVGTAGIGCGYLSTLEPGGSGELDCGLVKCNNNVVVTLNVDPNSLSGTGWVVAEHLAARQDLGAASLSIGGSTVINTSGQFVGPSGINTTGGAILGSLGVGYGSAAAGRINCQSLYAAAGGPDGGNIYFDSNIICYQGQNNVVINSNRVFTGAAVNVGSGNVTCGTANISGALQCGSFSMSGLLTCGQIAVGASAVDGVTVGLIGYGQFRAVAGNYGVIFRNDGATFYLLINDPAQPGGAPYGQWNNTRPFSMDLATGNLGMSQNVSIGGTLNVTGGPSGTTAAGVTITTTLSIGGTIYSNSGAVMQGTINAANFVASNTYGLYVNNTSGTGVPIIRLWNDNGVYIDNGGNNIWLRPASGSYVFTGNGGSSIFAPNGSVDLGSNSYRFGTLYVSNINVTGSITGINLSAGVSSISPGTLSGAVTFYQGTAMSVTQYGNGLMIAVVQDVSSNGSPTFSNLTVSSNISVGYIANHNGSWDADSNGNIGCQTLSCNTLSNGGSTCATNGVWGGHGVQCNAAVYANNFGIEGYAQGWPQTTSGTGPVGGPGMAVGQYSTFRTGDNRTVYVCGGLIIGVA